MKNKKFKRLAAFLLAMIFVFGIVGISSAAEEDPATDPAYAFRIPFSYGGKYLVDYVSLADHLNYLGLVGGYGDGDFGFNNSLTRAEAIVLVAACTAGRKNVLDMKTETTFNDVPEWAKYYIGWAQKNNITLGIGDNKFGSNNPINGNEFMTFMLRALGYNSATDFIYSQALNYAKSLDVLSGGEFDQINNDSIFYRKYSFLILDRVLRSEIKDTDTLLLDKLIDLGVVDKNRVYGEMIIIGETKPEQKRAIKNGYSEKVFQDCAALITSRRDAGFIVNDDFMNRAKDCTYRYLKEKGVFDCARSLKQILAHLSCSFMEQPTAGLARGADLTFQPTANSNVTFSHEFAHALSLDFDSKPFEESGADFFGYLYSNYSNNGYPYAGYITYIILAEILGIEDMNKELLSQSDIEYLLFKAAKKSGYNLDVAEFHKAYMRYFSLDREDYELAKISPDLAYVKAELFNLGKSYLIGKISAGEFDKATYQKAMDNLFVMGQYLLHPNYEKYYSDAFLDSNVPIVYFENQEFQDLAKEFISALSARKNCSKEILAAYYEENKATRFCRKYTGRDEGKICSKVLAFGVKNRGEFYYFETEEEAKAYNEKYGGDILPFTYYGYIPKTYK